jgi:hypothetical protein
LLSHGRYFDADGDKVIRRIFGEPRPDDARHDHTSRATPVSLTRT